MADVRWGFLGAGNISHALAGAVHAADGAVLRAVGARDAARAEALGPQQAYPSYEEVLADPAVDAVYISLANHQHVPWAVRAVAAGKAVLCEKPLGLTAAEVDELTAVAEDAGALVVEAMWYRWHPRVREAERLVAEGAIGPVRRVAAGFCFDADLTGNYRLDPAYGGGALYDVGCYPISAAVRAFGGGPDRVAVRRTTGPTGVDLHTDAVLSYPAGAAETSCGFTGPDRQWLTIRGDGGELELPVLPFMLRHQPAELWHSDGREVHRRGYPATDPYRLMIEAVSARVRGEEGEGAWVLPLADSRACAAVLDAVRAAHAEVTGPDPIG
jgi:D-xylose 1-dehydrogenase (NADP+, D-xylono-1,5-lactone-forming)